jgi:hypothetical protein
MHHKLGRPAGSEDVDGPTAGFGGRSSNGGGGDII